MCLRKPFAVGQPVSLRASIGVCFHTGESVVSPQEMIAKADAALYHVKVNGRDGYQAVTC